jgi:mercuric ion transport protein
VRSALLGVKGVTRAKVTLDPPEAVVTYDPKRVTVDDLVTAVSKAEGISSYSATVKPKR